MTIKQRAMLGDKEAQRQITERGELLPCPWCNRLPDVEYDTMGPFMWTAICPRCGVYQSCTDEEWQARLDWNSRAPILSAEEMEMLEGME